MHQSITYDLDEVYPFRVPGPGEKRFSIPFYGKASIAYRNADDWWLDGLEVDAHTGTDWRKPDTSTEPVSKGHFIWEAVEAFIKDELSEQIDSAIRTDIAERREEHRIQEWKDRKHDFV